MEELTREKYHEGLTSLQAVRPKGQNTEITWEVSKTAKRNCEPKNRKF